MHKLLDKETARFFVNITFSYTHRGLMCTISLIFKRLLGNRGYFKDLNHVIDSTSQIKMLIFVSGEKTQSLLSPCFV